MVSIPSFSGRRPALWELGPPTASHPASSGFFSWVGPVGPGSMEPCGHRGPWAGTTSPQLCVHLGKKGAQESMEPVLWSRLGARAQGAVRPLPVLTFKMTFRATFQPPLLHSPLQSIWGNGQGGVTWDGVCAPRREHGKEGPSSPLLCGSHLGNLSANGKRASSHFSEGDGKP